MILWTKDPAERYARLANKVLNDKKKTIEKLKILVEISCTSSPSHLIAVRKAYCSLYDSSLEEDIASSVPFPLAKVLYLTLLSFSCLISNSISLSNTTFMVIIKMDSCW